VLRMVNRCGQFLDSNCAVRRCNQPSLDVPVILAAFIPIEEWVYWILGAYRVDLALPVVEPEPTRKFSGGGFRSKEPQNSHCLLSRLVRSMSDGASFVWSASSRASKLANCSACHSGVAGRT
jgi:hypothetical protein